MSRSLPLSRLRYAVIDTETTGLSPARDRIVEVAVTVIDRNGNRLDEYESLVNPQRDVGATNVHGITAGMVANAPGFAEVAGELVARLGGAVLVAHNLRFDLAFLNAELQRLGVRLPAVPRLCTLALSRRCLASATCHNLAATCQVLGISLDKAHAAVHDARATGAVLTRLLNRSRAQTLGDLLDNPPPLVMNPVPLRRTGAALTRRQTGVAIAEKRQSYLSQLVQRLGRSPAPQVGDDGIGLYLGLLDRVLEDRRIDSDESEMLLAMAKEWGFSTADAQRAHQIYTGMLVTAAMADGILTETEKKDLQLVAVTLGISQPELDSMLQSARTLQKSPTGNAAGGKLAGKCVCFTGQLAGPGGGGITRADAEAQATKAGLVVAKSLTKKVDLLVVADPDTQSGKAQKAHQYGTRIMAEAVFWSSIGL